MAGRQVVLKSLKERKKWLWLLECWSREDTAQDRSKAFPKGKS
jgi:hypothetical protein